LGYEKNIVYISIHTHMLVPGLRWDKNCKFSNSSSYPTIFNNSTGKIDLNSARSRLDRSQTDIPQFFSSDYGDPLINRTVPYMGNRTPMGPCGAIWIYMSIMGRWARPTGGQAGQCGSGRQVGAVGHPLSPSMNSFHKHSSLHGQPVRMKCAFFILFGYGHPRAQPGTFALALSTRPGSATVMSKEQTEGISNRSGRRGCKYWGACGFRILRSGVECAGELKTKTGSPRGCKSRKEGGRPVHHPKYQYELLA
jgi:hypothetical protein